MTLAPYFLALAAGAPSSDDWRPLAPPILCAPAPEVVLPPMLVDGSHLEIPHADGRSPLASRGSALPFATFLQMAEEGARLGGSRLELQRQGGGALVRGDEVTLAGVARLARSLDVAARALSIDLDVRLATEGAGEALTFRRRVRSGDLVFLGSRETRAYVAGFDVEVAAQSGQSEPILGRAHAGRGLHLFAARARGGERVFVWGLVDVASVLDVEAFDPETADLGIVEEPRIACAQAAFSGLLGADEPLIVELAGAGGPSVKLEVRATTTRDAEVDTAIAGEGFAVVDLALVSAELPALVPCAAGALLTAPGASGGDEPGLAPWPPSALAALVENARGAGNKTTRASLYWNDRCLFVPRTDASALSTARVLARAAEDARTAGGRVELANADARASLPTTALAPARVILGIQRPLLSEYRLEVAPQIWMPAPTIETTFDGLCLDVLALPAAAEAGVWLASSGPVTVRERAAAQIGRLQLATRRLEAGRARVEAAAETRLELSGTPAGTVTLRYVPR